MQKNAPNVLPHATLMLTHLPSLYLYSPSPFSLTSAFFSLSLVSVPDRSYTSPSLWWTMAFCRIGTKPMLEGRDLLCSNGNQSTKLASSSCGSPSNFSKFVCITSPHHRFFTPRTYSISRPTDSSRRSGARLRCSAGNTVSPPESKENARNISSICIEEESGHVTKFKISDFELCNHVSVGLAGRGDELIFEATVKDSHSPLYNSRVVLRQLTSSQAQRRGRRSLEVLKKLVRRQLMYDSYAMQVHGYVSTSDGGDSSSFTLVHGYHGSYSLRHWLQLSDWLPTLEATLALDEECARKVGDATTGGPAISRQLRLIRILMRDLLIGVNYLHSLGLAHTELRLENVHISPVDRHIKVGILGNAADFYDNNLNNSTLEGNMDRRQLMIAFDMRCVGFMMAKMVLRELMDPSHFMKFKSFLMKGNDPSCLREFLLPILCRNSPSGNAGLQILDRNWGAGWNLLSRLLATKPSERISCLDALRHPFLCGPRWRVDPSMDIIKWGLGSTAVRIAEEYIYGRHQRSRLAYFIELMEMLNTNPKAKDWLEILPGRWRLLYCTGRHIGLTLRQASPRVLIGHVFLTFMPSPDSDNTLSLASEIGFTVMPGTQWPHNKIGITGKLNVSSSVRLTAGSRLYLKEEKDGGKHSLHLLNAQGSVTRKLSGRKWRRASPIKELPSSLPVANLISDEVEVTMSIDSPTPQDVGAAGNVLREVRTQVPPEIFDLSKLICGTFLDSRMLVLRGVNGCALLFTRSCGL